MSGEERAPHEAEAEPAPEHGDAGDDPTGRAMAAAGALIQAQMHANEAALQQIFAEFRALSTLIPGTVAPKEDDDRFDDVPV